MLPLYRHPHFTFHFAESRVIRRFHLDGVEAGRRVSVFEIDTESDERLGLLTEAVVGAGGWVELAEPLIVRAGDTFIAVPDDEAKEAPTGGFPSWRSRVEEPIWKR